MDCADISSTCHIIRLHHLAIEKRLRNGFRLVLSILLLLALVYLVQRYIGWGRLLAPWREVSWPAIATAATLTLVSYWLRTWRLYDYFRPELAGGLLACLKLTLQHNMLNNLLPMRTGEISFPVLMHRYFFVPVTRSVSALLWFRLLDLHVLALLALWAAAGQWWPVWVSAVLALLAMPVPYLIAHYSGKLAARFDEGSKLAQALNALPQDGGAFWRAWWWTAVNWVVKIAAFAWVLQLFIDVSWAAAWMGAMAGDLTSVLPVHGVAGAGTYEAGVVAGLLPYGADAKAALAAAVNLHLFLLASTLIGGSVSLVLPGAARRR